MISEAQALTPGLHQAPMSPLDLVKLTPLMQRTSGRAEILIGLIDGPVAMSHPDLGGTRIQEIPGRLAGTCGSATSTACRHGTFVAGILSAKRGSDAPAICPDCALLVRPIFADTVSERAQMPSATPDELAAAIIDSVDAGARLINVSAALAQPSTREERRLVDALDYAERRGAITVVAAGNQGTIGSSSMTRHPWVIPVVACDLRGRPMPESNLGRTMARRGLRAPGNEITSLGAEGRAASFGGTSAATPFVTGTVALLWSEFPAATPDQVRTAIEHAHRPRLATVVPPLLDAWAAYLVMAKHHS